MGSFALVWLLALCFLWLLAIPELMLETKLLCRYTISVEPRMHALSIPTWIIHISSVIEWIVAIWLIWTYSEVSRNSAWRMLSLAMLPALISAMCACTWHLFDNASGLEWLVTLQAAMTLIGNITLCAAGWWIWRAAQASRNKQQI